MLKRVFLSLVLVVVAIALQANYVEVDSLRNDAMKGLNVEVGYEQEMAAWAYYRINGADGIAKDYNEAVKILKKLVERDKNKVASDKFTFVVEGYNLLGDCYEKGYGVIRNIDMAKIYWQMAANYNHDDAFNKLEQYKSPKAFTVNGVSFNMVFVEGGTFRMGSNDSEAELDEKPVHSVTLSDYYIGETEVTQELWEAVMGSNPSYFKGSKKPVEEVSWKDCQEFIKKLNRLTGKTFRLPTEAEWEYAARGGNKSKGYKYSGSNTIGDVAWYNDNSLSTTHTVGTKAPNELGLYDMSGNVWEWCADWYGYYSSSSQTNPTGPTSGARRVLRGGSWYSQASYCRVAIRNSSSPGSRYFRSGFRLALCP